MLDQKWDETWVEHYSKLAGMDEAGRGPLAGPVVAVCVLVHSDIDQALHENFPFINDSKRMTPKQRNQVYQWIDDHDIPYGVGWATEDEIDCVNILKATQNAMIRAKEAIKEDLDYCLVDGCGFLFPFPHQQIVGGDGKSLRIALASIIAKEIRDQYMKSLSNEYPEYTFHAHKGYPTRNHHQEISESGVHPIHRFSYRPVWEWCNRIEWGRWLEEGRITANRYQSVLNRWEGEK